MRFGKLDTDYTDAAALDAARDLEGTLNSWVPPWIGPGYRCQCTATTRCDACRAYVDSDGPPPAPPRPVSPRMEAKRAYRATRRLHINAYKRGYRARKRLEATHGA